MPVVSVRPARWQDILFVRSVRNDSGSRRWSANGGRVGLLRHFAWWHGRSRSGEAVFIVWIDGRRSGYVRAKPADGGFTELSVALKGDVRGRGAGSEAIRQFTQRTASLSEPRGWRARVDARNSSSIRAFTAAGFSQLAKTQDDGEPYLTFERQNWRAS